MGLGHFTDVDGNGLDDTGQAPENNKHDLSDSDEVAEHLERAEGASGAEEAHNPEDQNDDIEAGPEKVVQDEKPEGESLPGNDSDSIEDNPETVMQHRPVDGGDPLPQNDDSKSIESGSESVVLHRSPDEAESLTQNKERVESGAETVVGHKTTENGDAPPDGDAPPGGAPDNAHQRPDGGGDIAETYKDWCEYDAKSREIGLDASLSKEEKVRAIQTVYERTEDKTDICAPSDSQYVDCFGETGRIEYAWPKNMGFEAETERAISREDALPETWDRYGHMAGFNFSPIPDDGPYTTGERSIPYLDNEGAYHSGCFHAESYFDKIDSLQHGDILGLNSILSSEGYAPMCHEEFDDILFDYRGSCDNMRSALDSDVDVSYGVKGLAASWGDMPGGAEQLTFPLSGEQMERLGIMQEEEI